jgi:putative SOS response-associated peptidase YedK
MCGRYYIDSDLAKEVQKVISEKHKKLRFEEKDIFPGSKGVVLMPEKSEILPKEIFWGFPGKEKSRLIINARSETALQKPMFSDCLSHRRCIIPARSFYEWDRSKNKVTYSLDTNEAIYLAGIYSIFNNEVCFTILTTAANASVSDVHDRMPVVISQNNIPEWLFDDENAVKLISNEMPMFVAKRDYEQLSLF